MIECFEVIIEKREQGTFRRPLVGCRRFGLGRALETLRQMASVGAPRVVEQTLEVSCPHPPLMTGLRATSEAMVKASSSLSLFFFVFLYATPV